MDENNTRARWWKQADLALWVMGTLLAALTALLVGMIVSNMLEQDEGADVGETSAAAVAVMSTAPGVGAVEEGVLDPAPPAVPETLPHAIYVWQRRWDGELMKALARTSAKSSRFVVLSAEITWQRGRPRTFRVPVDYAALKATGKPVGLAVRIQPYNGRFSASDSIAGYLKRLVTRLVAAARAAGVEPVEVQIDFDCAERRLNGYRAWVETLRKTVRPIPLTITTLPSWLKHASFGKLVKASDGFTLQVHMRKPPPEARGTITLCHPASARKWVEKASSAGVPFHVALPTYGYLGVFWQDGGFIGSHIAGSPREAGTMLRIVQANPFELAGLVRDWDAKRPDNLQGFIWYRLPVDGDTMNWTWRTLATVIDRKTPTRSMRVEIEYPRPTSAGVYLVNSGTVDLPADIRIGLTWQGGTRESGDALSGYTIVETKPTALTLESTDDAHLVRVAPGERLKVAELRFNRKTNVTGTATARGRD